MTTPTTTTELESEPKPTPELAFPAQYASAPKKRPEYLDGLIIKAHFAYPIRYIHRTDHLFPRYLLVPPNCTLLAPYIPATSKWAVCRVHKNKRNVMVGRYELLNTFPTKRAAIAAIKVLLACQT